MRMLKTLLEMQSEGMVDLSSEYYVGLDEWQGIDYKTKGSCSQVMRDHFYTPARIPEDRMRLWDGKTTNPEKECAEVDEWIVQHGGIGLVLLGIGMNGHIGFIEPGAPLDRNCMSVRLDGVTAEVGRKYFDGAACPEYGLTIGLPRLLQANKVILIASGRHKSSIVKRSIIDSPSPSVPASLLQQHEDLSICLDEDVWRNL